MSREIKVPAAGESVSSASVAQWHKKEGDFVNIGEILVSLDTDKVSTDLEAESSGVLQILIDEGEEVAIGKVIGKIDDSVAKKPESDISVSNSKAYSPKKEENQSSSSSVKKEIKKKEIPSQKFESVPSQSPFQSPESKIEKQEKQVIDDSRVIRKKMSMLRKKIAHHLVEAQQTAAILSTFNEVDMSAIMKLRGEMKTDFLEKHSVKLGFMSFFTKAVVEALKTCPTMNARIDDSDILYYNYYDIGIAIGTEKGLVVPVIRDCDKKSFADIEKEILSYADKAKEGKIALEDLQGGGFTISNGGIYGSLLSTPIINFPQSGILGMHTIQKRPVVIDDEIVIRPMMYLALSYDHRLLDGKEAVAFLSHIKDSLEMPARLLLDI